MPTWSTLAPVLKRPISLEWRLTAARTTMPPLAPPPMTTQVGWACSKACCSCSAASLRALRFASAALASSSARLSATVFTGLASTVGGEGSSRCSACAGEACCTFSFFQGQAPNAARCQEPSCSCISVMLQCSTQWGVWFSSRCCRGQRASARKSCVAPWPTTNTEPPLAAASAAWIAFLCRFVGFLRPSASPFRMRPTTSG
mmetsp:Transcript_74993/g.219679  ORF Transcript_74993/g.219679 Transcript_74993/m.219679 type:complete len:202 (+) Transcript_74993:209-814(+)